MEYAIELMVGICFLVLGLSIFLRTHDWIGWVGHIKQQGRNASLVLGVVNLLLGSFILAFHWVWEGLAMIVTIFGVLFTFRSVILLLCPGFLPKMLECLTPRLNGVFKLAGVIVTLIGAIVLYDWNMSTGSF